MDEEEYRMSIDTSNIEWYMGYLTKETTTCRHIYCMSRYNEAQSIRNVYPKNCGPCFISIFQFIRDNILPKLSVVKNESTSSSLDSEEEFHNQAHDVMSYLKEHANDKMCDEFALRSSSDISVLHVRKVMHELIHISMSPETRLATTHMGMRGEKRRLEKNKPKWQREMRAKTITADQK